ncbi:hypothetical protein PFICI_02318 [Pestalotiopsis fici W106-1]|uniref:Heterokaryon incompatibility domain-containing protein n=1 Tax=Pestalotiopsis fici (strain W106-1 / CGMCC3.15140) TaxID=1229662 RepID=W3XDY0_PESFW|nr:uncharacterized protein PFICI_02318 [Pestalotiopsis fici W106-1]ETS84293.1 hypothetical protein PFICI_02318 [Pestalotiopsis fici W106-1]
MGTEYNPIYTPLKDPDNYFRLLKLDEASDQDEEKLSGVLIQLPRGDAPYYHPISYTWGIEKPAAEILLRHSEEAEQSHPFLMRPNLKVLLQHARRSFKNRVIWVDAICINQDDTVEKGHQVRTMDKVYRGQNTFVWLGEPSHNSDLALDLIDRFEAHLEKLDRSHITNLFQSKSAQYLADRAEATRKFTQACDEFLMSPTNTDECWVAIYDFFARPWFTRRWVVQEFALSGHVDFWIGSRKKCLEYVNILSMKLKENPYHRVKGHQRHNVWERIPGHANVLPSMDVDPVDSIYRLTSTQKAIQKGKTIELSLEKLLDDFAGFACFDPLDGVYALLSMASDVNMSDWLPDYSPTATVADLYRKVSLQIMKRTGSEDIICHCADDKSRQMIESLKSGWTPWFAPRDETFRNENNVRVDKNTSDDNEPSESFVCRILGYKRNSLTTFGQPLRRLPLDHPERVEADNILCDGCDKKIEGAGVRCQDCSGHFDYCFDCAKMSDMTHDPLHHFKLHNGAVYYAFNISSSLLHGFHDDIDTCSFFPGLGRFVDTIKAIAPCEPPSALRHGKGITIRLPWEQWIRMPGMEHHVDNDGCPSDHLLRAMTGNRRIVGDRVRHVTNSWLSDARRAFRASFVEKHGQQEKNKRASLPLSHFGQEALCSMGFMLSGSRQFATTTTSFGLVPIRSCAGDRIAILVGCTVPVVLRKMTTANGLDLWALIGECYIDGMMEGELSHKLDKDFDKILLY